VGMQRPIRFALSANGRLDHHRVWAVCVGCAVAGALEYECAGDARPRLVAFLLGVSGAAFVAVRLRHDHGLFLPACIHYNLAAACVLGATAWFIGKRSKFYCRDRPAQRGEDRAPKARHPVEQDGTTQWVQRGASE